jgi:hypothetical protein
MFNLKSKLSLSREGRTGNFSKLLIICLLMFLLSFSPSKFTKDAKGSYVREELFEPLNAILLPNTTIAYIPFIAGWVCSEPGQQGELQRIEVWAIDGEEMRYVSTKVLGVTLDSCYLDGYYDYSFNEKEVKRVEPECKQDESGGYYLCYDDTLKEAIGYARGSEPPNGWIEENIQTLLKIYDSITANTTLEIDLSDIYEEVEVGENYVLVLKGYFKRAGVTEDPIPIEREVSLLVRRELNKTFRTMDFYKGDGHLHSKYSDAIAPPWKRIDHGSTSNEETKLDTIAHYRRKVLDYDWIIMTDHADYFWDGQKSQCPPFDPINENANFEAYKGACANAQSTERAESAQEGNSKPWFSVVPAEELTVCAHNIDTNCESKCYNCTEIFPPGAKSCDVLNYYGCHEDQPVKRFPNKLINGMDFVKNKANTFIGSECSSLSGPDGWCIIAHPGGSPSWKNFPETAEEWEKLWGQHKCPSIIRSFDDEDPTNDGYGFMGIEVISGGEESIEAWDDYLHTDLDITFRHWDEDPNKSNFIIGVGNSDSHCWHYLVEDITALKAGHASGFCLVSDWEAREVPYFSQYWYARFQTFKFSKGCTFISIPGWSGSHSELIKAIRSCGKDHLGLSASRFGSFATFTAGGTRSGGMKEGVSGDLVLEVWAYPLCIAEDPYKEGVSKIVVYGDSTSTDPPYTPRELKTITYDDPEDPNDPPYELSVPGWPITIPYEKIKNLDYVRVVVYFKLYNYGLPNWVIHADDICYCNPVIIKK